MTINFSSKESSIGFAYLKALLEQEILKAFIPRSWCLLEPIEHLTEFVDMIRTLEFFKAQWLPNIDFFGEWSIEKCTLDIHLIYLEVVMAVKASRN
jgi:hypothetical protein